MPRSKAAFSTALALCSALLAFWALSWSQLSAWAEGENARQLERWEHGWRWDFAHAEALVGGTPRDLNANVSNNGLQIDAVNPNGYIALNFSGRRLDSRRFQHLMADASRSFSAHLYFRETLSHPEFRGDIQIQPGQPVVLDSVPWSDARHHPAPWGGQTGRVSSLRVHIVDSGALLLRDIKIVPASEQTAPPVVGIEGWRWTPELALDDIADQLSQKPSARLEVSIPAWAFPVTLILIAAVVALAYRRRPVTVGLVLSMIGYCCAPWSELRWISLIIFCILALIGIVRRSTSPTAHTASSRSAFGALIPVSFIFPALIAGLWVASGNHVDGLDALRKLAVYLPWALIQQLILTRVLLDNGDGQSPVLSGIAFGLMHAPNFALMVFTLILGCVCALHFARHQRLLPLVILHAGSGTALLLTAPQWILANGDIGWRYFPFGA